jgi:hypothetical protein
VTPAFASVVIARPAARASAATHMRAAVRVLPWVRTAAVSAHR